jgi:hypothetical protein
MIFNNGIVTIGGNWINNSSEKFKGDITYVEILTTNDGLNQYSETKVPNNPSAVTKFRFPKGTCNEVYRPNKNTYYGGTDCGKEDKTDWNINLTIFDDWIAKGGECDDYQHTDRGCG